MNVPLRAARGRKDANTACDAWGRVGSLGHVLQSCPRTHASRVARHNKVVELVASNARKKGWDVLVEPVIPTPAGVRRPDLVIHGLRKTTFVIDATVVADNADLTDRHNGKCHYYDIPAIRQWVKGVRPDIDDVKFSSVT